MSKKIPKKSSGKMKITEAKKFIGLKLKEIDICNNNDNYSVDQILYKFKELIIDVNIFMKSYTPLTDSQYIGLVKILNELDDDGPSDEDILEELDAAEPIKIKNGKEKKRKKRNLKKKR